MNAHTFRRSIASALFVAAFAAVPTASAVGITWFDTFKYGAKSDWQENNSSYQIGRFGAGYDVGGSVGANRYSRALRAEGHVSTDLMLFGHRATVLNVYGQAVANPSDAYVEAGVYVLGQELMYSRQNAELNTNFNKSVTFLESPPVVFWAGPVPITFKAAASGHLGIDLGASATTTGVGITVQPYAGIWGSVTAGFDILIAEVGLSVNLQLAQISLPLNGGISLVDSVVNYGVNVQFAVETLKGHFSFVWKALFGMYSGEYVLFSWNGFRWEFPLFQEAGTIQL